jgi:hypothetical protein
MRVRMLVNGIDRGEGATASREALRTLVAILAWLNGKAERPQAAQDASATAAARRLLLRRGLRSIRIGGAATGGAPLDLQTSEAQRADALPGWAAPCALHPRLPPRLSPAPAEACS